MKFEAGDFLEKYKEDQFFVAFLKGKKEWFPILLTDDKAEGSVQPDTLCVSRDEEKIREAATFIKDKVPSTEAMEVLYLFPVEIKNLLERYALRRIELLT